ncbi:MAG TPA: hypothetical protein VFD30_14060 [Terriglobia bacterium]|nr:hypothetical protein [Terriglobia bacterium]
MFPYLTSYVAANPDYEPGLKNRFFVRAHNGETVRPSFPLIEGEKFVMTVDLDFTSSPAVDW